MAKLQDTEIFGDLNVTGDVTIAGTDIGLDGTMPSGRHWKDYNIFVSTAGTLGIHSTSGVLNVETDGNLVTAGDLTVNGTTSSTISHGDLTYGLGTAITLALGTDDTKGGAIRLYGGTAGGGGLIQATTNNLHLDSLGGAIYLGNYDNSIIYFNGTSSYIAADGDTQLAGDLTVSGTGASSCAGDFHILGDHELGCVQSVADPEGLVMQIDYTDGNTDSRLFFREASGNLYGGSIIYAADVSPVFDGTTFTNCSAANSLYFLTHNNSATGTVFMSVLRGSTGPTIPGTLTAGGLSVSGSMTLNGAITGVNSIACDLGTSINEFSIDGAMAGNSDDAVPTEKAVVTYVAAAGGGPGSGTQYTIPVWATTTTLGNSMIAQDSGATLATLTGALTVSGAFKAGADGFDIDTSGNITDCGTIAATTVNCSSLVSTGHIHTGDSDYLYLRGATYDTYLYNPGDRIKMVVHDYLEIKPDNDDYGIILRDSGSDSYYVNIKNVNGVAYFGDTTSTVGNMLKIDGTAVTVPGTFTAGAAGFDVNASGSITDCGSIAMGGALTGVTSIDASSTIRGTGIRVDGAVTGSLGTATLSYYSTNQLLRIYCGTNTNYLSIDVDGAADTGETTISTAGNNHVTIAPHVSFGCHFQYQAGSGAGVLVRPESDNTGWLGGSSYTWYQAHITTVSSTDILFANDFRMLEVCKPGLWYDGNPPDKKDSKYVHSRDRYANVEEEDGAKPGLVWKNNKDEIIAVLDEDGDFYIKGKMKSLDEWEGLEAWKEHVTSRGS